MKPYFSKKDFSLCDVPVPEGYPQSQTHTGVAYSQGLYLLVASPHPLVYSRQDIIHHPSLVNRFSIKLEMKKALKKVFKRYPFRKWGRADYYENPCLYIGKLLKYNTFPPPPNTHHHPASLAHNATTNVFYAY